MNERWVLHVDLDAFFASVEEILNPTLRGLPLIVGGRPEERGVVSSANYAARKFGVRSAMPTAQALRLCPQAIVLPARHGVYGRYSRQVMNMLHEYTPLVEQVSIDEAFMDITGCEPHWGPPLEMAAGIQKRIQDELGLSASIGIAGNKLVAKVASDYGKPHGLILVPQGEEAAFLAPLEVERLWGVGKVTAKRLHAVGIHTIGDLAGLSQEQLEALFGSQGIELWYRAHGIDHRPAEPTEEIKSVSHEETFAHDIRDPKELQSTLLRLSEQVGARLRQLGWQARTISLKLRYEDFTTITRQVTLDEPTDIDAEIYELARVLWEKAWQRSRPVRLLGVGVHNLVRGGRQLSLFGETSDELQREKLRRLNQAVDRIRGRYGGHALERASLMQRRPSTRKRA